MSAIGTIIAAIIGAAATVTTTSLNNQAIEDSNQQGLKLANIRREDELRNQRETDRLNRAQIRLNKKELQYKREAELYERGERALERGMLTRDRQFNKQIQLLNRNDAMRNQLVNIWRR